MHVYVSKFVSIGLFYRPLAAKKNLCLFWNSAFSGVDSWRQSEKVEHGCTTINLPLSNGVKIVFVLQRYHGEIGRTISDAQKRGGQKKRDGQTKYSTFFANPAAGEIRALPNLAW